jgi:hypothetical protein
VLQWRACSDRGNKMMPLSVLTVIPRIEAALGVPSPLSTLSWPRRFVSWCREHSTMATCPACRVLPLACLCTRMVSSTIDFSHRSLSRTSLPVAACWLASIAAGCRCYAGDAERMRLTMLIMMMPADSNADRRSCELLSHARRVR